MVLVASCESMCDFSELPDVVWVRILSCLTLKERYHVSLTCHALQDVFNHPSLWYKCHITLLASSQRGLGHDDNILISQQQLCLIEKFGKYFQDLDLAITGYVHAIPPHIGNVLAALNESCRYETLTLSIGTVLSKRDFWWERPNSFDLKPVLEVIERSYRLKTLNIRSWPMYADIQSPDIVLDAINRNQIMKDTLSSLNLFYKTADNSTWSTLNPHLPSPEGVMNTVSSLDSLECLKLQSPMLSNALICALAEKRHVKLKRLAVLVVYSRRNESTNFPEISAKSWLKLKQSSPEVNVDFTLVTRMPAFEKSAVFKPEIPVSSINFMKYSECTKEDLLSIAEKYHSSLKKFTDYSFSSDLDEQLLNLTEKCNHLNFLVYAGSLTHHTVTSLAKMRGRAWYYFQVCSENVITTEQQSGVDENQVLYQAADGTYELSSRLQYQDELQRQAILEIMMQEVGLHLGRTWIPMDVKDDARMRLIDKIYADATASSEKL